MRIASENRLANGQVPNATLCTQVGTQGAGRSPVSRVGDGILPSHRDAALLGKRLELGGPLQQLLRPDPSNFRTLSSGAPDLRRVELDHLPALKDGDLVVVQPEASSNFGHTKHLSQEQSLDSVSDRDDGAVEIRSDDLSPLPSRLSRQSAWPSGWSGRSRHPARSSPKTPRLNMHARLACTLPRRAAAIRQTPRWPKA